MIIPKSKKLKSIILSNN